MNLPENFTQYTKSLMGDDLFARFAAALDEEPPVSVRVNTLKTSQAPACGKPIGWCADGYYLKERPPFTFDPLLHGGCYYVQEASSMFIHHVLREHVASPVRMLDLCAAPGGKTTAAMGALPAGSTMFCNEPIGLRAQVLAENIQKWGSPDVVVTNSYPGDYARSGLAFDVVLCDVPCSGEGMFRKDSGAVAEWSVQNVEKCRQLQRAIVADAWRCLVPGGLLVYSTCTFNAHENEENVQWICSELGAEVLPVGVASDWGVTGSLLPGFDAPVFRFIPGVACGEGLFMAVLRKTDDTPCGQRKPKRKAAKGVASGGVKAAAEWIDDPSRYAMVADGDSIVAIPKAMEEAWLTAKAALRPIHAGVTIATVKGRDIVPAQSLALSAALAKGAFPTMPLDYAESISYLRREALPPHDAAPRGIVLATYKGVGLGFLKNLGNRTNNMYPQEWRIRSSHAPSPYSLFNS